MAVAGVAGLAIHLSATAPQRRGAGGEGLLEVDVAGEADGEQLAEGEDGPTTSAKPDRHGGVTVARADERHAGQGGERHGASAVNLADAVEPIQRTPDAASHRDRDQEQRLATSRRRASRDDRRATTHPMELTFLASGTFERVERRPLDPRDPSRGSLIAPTAAVLGGEPGARAELASMSAFGPSRGADERGGERASPGVGVRDGREGDDHRSAARIARSRPSVVEAAPAVPASMHARPNDTVDSDQEVSRMVASEVHASFAGALPGSGVGGSEGATATPGYGGGGRGSVSRPMGTGDGEIFDWNTSDPHLAPYFRRLHAKIDPLWRDAFPRWAIAELQQGTVILEFVIALDGRARVLWPPVRQSGFPEFDRRCAEAIRHAAPFDPLPPELRAGGRTELRIRAPFEAKNPIVK